MADLVSGDTRDPIAEALHYLSEQFSVTRDEWRRRFHGGDMLLDGLTSLGFAHERGGRFAVSPAGRRRINASGVPA